METTLESLETAQCIAIEDDNDIAPLNLGKENGRYMSELKEGKRAKYM